MGCLVKISAARIFFGTQRLTNTSNVLKGRNTSDRKKQKISNQQQRDERASREQQFLTLRIDMQESVIASVGVSQDGRLLCNCKRNEKFEPEKFVEIRKSQILTQNCLIQRIFESNHFFHPQYSRSISKLQPRHQIAAKKRETLPIPNQLSSLPPSPTFTSKNFVVVIWWQRKRIFFNSGFQRGFS